MGRIKRLPVSDQYSAERHWPRGLRPWLHTVAPTGAFLFQFFLRRARRARRVAVVDFDFVIRASLCVFVVHFLSNDFCNRGTKRIYIRFRNARDVDPA